MSTEQTVQKLGILKRMLAVREEIGAIGKNKQMDMGGGRGYKYRGIEDLYFAAQAALDKHGVVVVTTVQPNTVKFESWESTTKSGSTKMNTRCTAVVNVQFFDPDDGSQLMASGMGEGVDDSDKAAGKATSYGMKNIYFHTFVVPTEDPDAERPDTSVKSKKKTESKEPNITRSEFNEARAVTEIGLATNLMELKAAWDAIPSDARTAGVIEAKDKRKNELTA